MGNRKDRVYAIHSSGWHFTFIEMVLGERARAGAVGA
jgi:hypothetical protein